MEREGTGSSGDSRRKHKDTKTQRQKDRKTTRHKNRGGAPKRVCLGDGSGAVVLELSRPLRRMCGGGLPSASERASRCGPVAGGPDHLGAWDGKRSRFNVRGFVSVEVRIVAPTRLGWPRTMASPPRSRAWRLSQVSNSGGHDAGLDLRDAAERGDRRQRPRAGGRRLQDADRFGVGRAGFAAPKARRRERSTRRRLDEDAHSWGPPPSLPDRRKAVSIRCFGAGAHGLESRPRPGGRSVKGTGW
jgi:hypothetical protein